jgi:hypothetical protein
LVSNKSSKTEPINKTSQGSLQAGLLSDLQAEIISNS